MHEITRQFAYKKLQEYGQAIDVQDRHLAYFLALAEDGESCLNSAVQQDWVTNRCCVSFLPGAMRCMRLHDSLLIRSFRSMGKPSTYKIDISHISWRWRRMEKVASIVQ